MSPKNKFFVIVGGGFLALLLLFWIVYGTIRQPKTSLNNPADNLPAYTLSAQDEEYVKEFVKHFVFLYNSYAYADFSGLTGTGDYQTEEMQKQTVQKVAGLESSVPVGYSQISQAQMEKFKYTYPSAEILEVSVPVVVTVEESSGNYSPRGPSGSFSQNRTAKIQLKRDGVKWLANSFEVE